MIVVTSKDMIIKEDRGYVEDEWCTVRSSYAYAYAYVATVSSEDMLRTTISQSASSLSFFLICQRCPHWT